MEIEWTSVDSRLPDKPGWYLVFAPMYEAGSSSVLANHGGIMFSQFKVSKGGKGTWSIETGYYKRPGCVLYWTPLPIPVEYGWWEKTEHGEFWISRGKGSRFLG